MDCRCLAIALALLTAAPVRALDPLVLAIAQRDLRAMKRLIEEDPDRVERAEGWTPLQLAVSCRFKEGVDLLLARGARLDLFSAAGLGRVKEVKALLDADPLLVRSRTLERWTPLHWACANGEAASVRLLLARDAETDARDRDGQTPLHLAAQNGHKEAVAALLAAKAPVNARDGTKATPLHLAVKVAQKSAVQLLLAGGADVNARTGDEATPLHLLFECPREKDRAQAEAPDPAGVATLLLDHKANLAAEDRMARTPARLALEATGLPEARTVVLRRLPTHDLYQAAFLGEAKRVATLLKEGIKPDLTEEFDGRTALHWAAEGGRADVVRVLLAAGATADASDRSGWTPLGLAAVAGHGDVVRRLAAALAGKDRQETLNGALVRAVGAGRKSVVAILLGCGADVHAIVGGETLLHRAVNSDHRELLELLLARKVAPDRPDQRGETPLHLTARNGQEALAALLLARGAKVDATDPKGQTALHEAAGRGYLGMVKLLLRHKANLNARDHSRSTALHAAASFGQTDVVAFLLASGADVNARTRDGFTPLHLASPSPWPRFMMCYTPELAADAFRSAQGDFLGTVRLLLAHKADIRAKARDGRSPVYCFSQRGQGRLLRLLFDAGATGDVFCTAEGGSAEQMRKLVRADPRLLRARDANGVSVLERAARAGNAEVVGFLLDAEKDAKRKKAMTALALATAAGEGRLEVVKVLLARKSDVSARGIKGQTALHAAALQGRDRVVALLLAAGADVRAVNKKKQTALHLAALHGHEKVVGLLLARGAPVDSADAAGETPLHLALGINGPKVAALAEPSAAVRLLLRAKADLRARDEYDWTPLHVAADRGRGEAVARLLRLGAAVNAADGEGATPLHRAASHDDVEIVRLLLASGANVNARDKNGHTPLQWALTWAGVADPPGAAGLLRRAGGKTD